MADLRLSWAQHALQHARLIANASPGRGSATSAEAQAAEYVRQQLSGLAIPDIRQQSFQGQRSIWLFLALAFGFALMGHAAFWLLRTILDGFIAWGLALPGFALSAFLLWRKFTFRDFPLRTSLPHGSSQNVIAVIPPANHSSERQPVQVVLVSHLDSHRAVLWFASDLLVRVYAFLSPVAIYTILLAPLLYGLSELARLPALAWLMLPVIPLHFLAWFTGVTADLGPYSPGANDNAAAVGTLLALAERLQEEPLQNTEVWLAFTGCEETGCDGMRMLLSEYMPALRGALFIDFELVGIGDNLAYLQREGILRPRRIPGDVENLIKETGAEFDIHPLDAANFGAFTEMGAVWEAGCKGVCLLVHPSASPRLLEWHRLTDTAARLQPQALELAHAIAWKLLQKVDAL